MLGKGIMMNQQQLITISTSMAGLQTGLYCLLLFICIHRLVTATRFANQLLQKLHILAFIYIILQLGIQIFQLVTLIIGYTPQDNANIVLALNVFCLICDLNIVLLLTIYWKEIQGSFVYDSGILARKQIFGRFFVPLIWFLCYLGFILYLFGTGNLSLDPQTLGTTNKLVLFIIVQSITELMLIVASIWQTYQWRKLDSAIQSFSHVMSGVMNKTRFKAIFWCTVFFNFIRILFITYIAICAYQQDYQKLIISLNSFTLSAIIPISFYLFGFKVNQNSSQQGLIRRKSDSEKSKRSSSAHETELSHHSDKLSSNSKK